MKTFNAWLVTKEAKIPNPDTDLIYNFDKEAKLEIDAQGGGWKKVDPKIFRSWRGERRINGEPYDGEVYLYFTNELVRKPKSSTTK